MAMTCTTFSRVLLLAGLAAGPCFAQVAPSVQEQITLHARLAEQFLSQQQPVKAIPELEAVVALDPNNLEARGNLGVLLFFQGQFAKSIPNLSAAIALDPSLVKLQSLRGIAERRIGDETSGRTDLEAVFPKIEDEKLKMDVGRDLIDSFVVAGELNEGADIAAALLKLNPTDPGLLYTSYRIHNDLAVENLLELGLVAPNSGEVHRAMAHELQRERDLPGTIANLREALALNPSLPGIHYELAEALHASDDQRLRAESVEQYKLAVETAPGDPKAASRMGDIEVEGGHLEAAAASYQRAIKLMPDSEDANIGLANVLSQQGNQAGAAKLLQKVETADPSNVLAHFRLSAVYRKLNRPEDVKRELELYSRYKEEHEKLTAVYKNMRVATPEGGSPN
jgi:tetratricopeptide (TPR) repeat protein